MGKASRRKRLQHAEQPARSADRPRWEGADGFDYAWQVGEWYSEAGRELLAVTKNCTDTPEMAEEIRAMKALIYMSEMQANVADRQIATLEGVALAAGHDIRDRERPGTGTSVLPGRFEMLERVEEHRAYAAGLLDLAESQQDALRESTPILFDPLSAPEPDETAHFGLRLPFPVVTCDFLTSSGMSMPVQAVSGGQDKGEWVGLIAATMRQDENGVLDVWPVVTTLNSGYMDERQRPHSLLFGRARFGGPLPDPPEGLTRYDIDNASVWCHEASAAYDEKLWASLWVVLPANAAVSALRLLEAVNVTLEPASLSRAARRRAARDAADIPREVVIRTSRRESATKPIGHSDIDWQHRWTVRGHWKHFTKGPVFDANPRKRVYDEQYGECVRVWCPPFVKGPDDKPLILKARRADH